MYKFAQRKKHPHFHIVMIRKENPNVFILSARYVKIHSPTVKQTHCSSSGNMGGNK